MSETATNFSDGVLAVDGTPLKRKLARAMFRSRLRAFGLVVPLLLMIVLAFLIPIVVFLTQAVYNNKFERYMPNVSPMLTQWDGASDPTEDMFAALSPIW